MLITGIPGTGKTTVGDYLEKNLGYLHIDVEERQLKNLPWDFRNLNPDQEKVVLTWGFWPKDPEIGIIKSLKDSGFKLVWFDGNRDVARREFNRRGSVPPQAFDLQVKRIDDSKVIQDIKPIVVDPFDHRGLFKSVDQILEEIENG